MSAENQLRSLYYSTWYVFNYGQVFPLFEVHPNVARGSEEYSAKVSVKGLALHVYQVASGFWCRPKIN